MGEVKMFNQINKVGFALRTIALTALVTIGVASIIGSNEGSTPGRATTNSNYVVFLADKDTDEKIELYAYSLESGDVTKLNGPLTIGGNVTSFSISPDRLWVAYVADQDTDERYELYVATADGSAVTKVNDPTVNPASQVDDEPLWAPDSSRIAYRSDETDRVGVGGVDKAFVLRTVLPDGSVNVIVNPQGVTGSSVAATSFAWSPDSSRIAYLSNQDTTDVIELYTSLADSAIANQKLNGNLILGGNVAQYGWAPDSSRIAYRADQTMDGADELWTSTPTGDGNVQVSGPSSTGNEDVTVFAWAPDSSRLAYISDETVDEAFNLYTVQPDGNGRLQVSGDATTNGDVSGTPAWSPDSTYIAYVGDLDVDEQFELYTSLPTVALNSTKVNGTLSGGDVITGPFADSPPAWAPDNSGIAYLAQQDSIGVYEVYVGNPNGSGTFKVSGTLTSSNSVALGEDEEVWAPDSSRLMYEADQIDQGTMDLFSTRPTNNTSIARITDTPVQNDSLKSFGKWAPDSSRIVYVSSQDSADVDELYIADPDGGNNRKISGNLVPGGDVSSVYFEWAP
jgi:Tol biopolymer transport system component